jgi:methyltransferase-like protein/2-polyprenyl-3-methyl-5-hydroxy-6-metoxy-1,4-benzoquinol methylase
MPDTAPTAYDKILYPSYTRNQTHPDRLATIGILLGMEPAPVRKCRVLELGCGNGSNLTPIAFGLPETEFVGVDLAPTPISKARQMVTDLGLKNITFQNLSITDVTPDLGQFDYILCHGVYSWVPEQVRDAILRVCKQNLAPNGIAFVSYNAYPGNRLREMIREMMLYHIKGFDDPQEQIGQARALAAFVAAAEGDAGCYPKFLKEEMERFLRQDGNYVFHDALAEYNTPFYFHQFMEAADRHQLQYLGEADFHDMLDKRFPPEVAQKLNELSGNRVAREQYLDFLKGRSFRQTLLCHEGVALDLNLRPELAERFFVRALALSKSAESHPDKRELETFENVKGAAITTDCPVAKTAFAQLTEFWPVPIPFDQLFEQVIAHLEKSGWTSTDLKNDKRELAKTVLKSYAAGLLELHTYAPPHFSELTDKPKASPLVQWQVQNCNFVTTLFHGTIAVEDVVSRQLLLLLDGTRDRTTLRNELETVVKAREAAAGIEGLAQKPKEEIDRLLGQALNQNLAKMARMGLLVA